MRWGLIGGLALGGMTLLVGPERVAAGLAQVRTKAQNVVDQAVEDPVALRRQLEQLAEEYPERIDEVHGEIAEVEHQMSQITRDVEIASRVVAYTTEDVTVLKAKITKAEEELQTRFASGNAPAPDVVIRFEGLRFDLDEAYGEALRINNIRKTYSERLDFDQHQLKMLGEQKDRLVEILGKLEEDHATYQAQLWTLDRQIDAIARNERLIDLMEDQQETLAGYDKYEKATNLDQIHAKLADLQRVQKAQMERMQKKGFRQNYENKARMDLEEDTDAQDLLDRILEDIDGEETAEPEAGASVAWAPPIVID